MFLPVIMAGGTGSRLWPLSRELKPKQFLPLCSKHTMLQETLQRLEGMDCYEPIIICNENHRFLVAEQLRELGIDDATIILEPMGRNTAPAVAIAALCAARKYADPTLLVLAADHVIPERDAFQNAVSDAVVYAGMGKLVTFGIVPTKAETAYGYIHNGQELAPGVNEVSGFVEKPNLDKAQEYFESKQYLWNSGMFCFQVGTYLSELEEFSPEILTTCKEAFSRSEIDMDFVRLSAQIFSECPDGSLDYEVMEHTSKAVVVSLNASWNDVGSWDALWGQLEKDEDGNVIRGDVLAIDTEDSLIRSEGRLVAALGVKNLVVVETKDAVLIADKDHVQDVKKLVISLRSGGRVECVNHREVYRPWGEYDTVAAGERYQVKRITVRSGEKLSLQMHHHRAEHWVVVSGTAKVTIGQEVKLVSENQSTYIPIGEVHCLENPGKIPLEIIEVQSGGYLAEDDIVRLVDQYGRK